MAARPGLTVAAVHRGDQVIADPSRTPPCWRATPRTAGQPGGDVPQPRRVDGQRRGRARRPVVQASPALALGRGLDAELDVAGQGDADRAAVAGRFGLVKASGFEPDGDPRTVSSLETTRQASPTLSNVTSADTSSAPAACPPGRGRPTAPSRSTAWAAATSSSGWSDPRGSRSATPTGQIREEVGGLGGDCSDQSRIAGPHGLGVGWQPSSPPGVSLESPNRPTP